MEAFRLEAQMDPLSRPNLLRGACHDLDDAILQLDGHDLVGPLRFHNQHLFAEQGLALGGDEDVLGSDAQDQSSFPVVSK